jgi:NCAIR mutase (PurE)-related protein
VDPNKIRKLLEEVKLGKTNVEQALEELRFLPYEDMNDVRLDFHRELRTGQPEVIFCQSKTVEQVARIFEHLASQHQKVLGTRATPEMAEAVINRVPAAQYDPVSRLVYVKTNEVQPNSPDSGFILVACAGTADLPVAEEAALTAEFFGSQVMRAYDVGVAGIHRLFDKLNLLRSARIIISVAGMEGALTSVISGLVTCPVIGVPTSIGYGASFQGLAPLLSMLNSCAPGVAVVNIDNGYGAGAFAHKIMQAIIRNI